LFSASHHDVYINSLCAIANFLTILPATLNINNMATSQPKTIPTASELVNSTIAVAGQ